MDNNVNVASTLAFEYFKIGNGVTAFYVVQTLLFLNAIYKEPKLLALLYKNRQKARSITWFIASIYLGVILSCAAFEFWLNYASQPEACHIAVLASSLVAAVGRCCLISILAFGCSHLIKNLKDESTSS